MTQSFPTSTPSCTFHPDRGAYVRCQRCNSPICPQCQTPGSVGVRCPRCARAQQARQPRLRSLLGVPGSSGAPITTAYLVLCVLVHLASLIYREDIVLYGAMIPAYALVQPWRFVSTAFIHGSLMHLALNMWALWVVGRVIEPLLGRWRYAALLLTSALGSSVMVFVLSVATASDGQSMLTATVGASGVIFGLFAAMFVIQRKLHLDTRSLVALLVINVMFSFVGAGISWQGHLGGLLVGAAVAAFYSRHAGQSRSLTQADARRNAVLDGVVTAVIVLLLCAAPYGLAVLFFTA